jgi:hypothetical protein
VHPHQSVVDSAFSEVSAILDFAAALACLECHSFCRWLLDPQAIAQYPLKFGVIEFSFFSR